MTHMARKHRGRHATKRHRPTSFGTMHWFDEAAVIHDIKLVQGSTVYMATFHIRMKGLFMPGDPITIQAPDGTVVHEHEFAGPDPLAVAPGDMVALSLSITGRD
jgi:hypothetical protein